MHKNNNNSLHNNHLNAGRLPLPQNASFVRLHTILKIFPISKSTWWLGIREGRFPKGIKLSSNITAWRAEDIRQLIESVGKDQ
jgi:prophage regulatory protein